MKVAVKIVVVLCMVICGCSHIDDSCSSPNGLDEVTGSLELKFIEQLALTKSAVPIEASVIEDMNILIFNEVGANVYSRYLTGNDFSLNGVTFFRKERYTVYALANWGEEIQCREALQLEQLKYIAANPKDIMQERGSSVMCGKVENVLLDPDVPVVIELCRIVSKVTVKCNLSGISDNIEFEVSRIRIGNVPRTTSIFAGNVASDVAPGGEYTVSGLGSLPDEGVSFYLFENIQGTVSGAYDNKSKAELLGEGRRSVCTYVELVCNLVSSTQRGEIIYRFYLGSGNTDCNVVRNLEYSVTVYFKGDVSQNEMSVSVDSGALLDRVQRIQLYPAAMFFSAIALGNTHQCRAVIVPSTAYDKRCVWESTNMNVAKVSNTGLVTVIGPGKCKIVARSVENPSVHNTIPVEVMQ